MHIQALRILNFRGIAQIELADLGKLVILAGTNGSGKSSLLDALRFLKSSYGSYQQDEVVQFLGEYQLTAADHYRKLARDPTRPFEVEVVLRLDPGEIDYVRTNALRLLVSREVGRTRSRNHPMPPTELSALLADPGMNARAQRALADLQQELKTDPIARISVAPTGMERRPSVLLEGLFSVYEPGSLGVFDFHGPNRVYQREQEQHHLAITTDSQRQSALYNYSQKYHNLRSELLGSYTRELFLQPNVQALLQEGATTRTMRDLFAVFFPEKRFDGAHIDTTGHVTFPVKSEDAVCDLNDMSSGEREIVLGYARLLRSNLRNSVIIFDEPELHLNGAVTGRLARFYQEHLVDGPNNQLWLATHCDRLIAGTAGLPDATLVVLATPSATRSQARVITRERELEQTIASLTGGGYLPAKPVVLLEGDGFDKTLIETLFPALAMGHNFVSVGTKDRVERLMASLRQMAVTLNTNMSFQAIVDPDLSQSTRAEGTLCWEVFHAENHLLEAEYVLRALKATMLHDCGYESPEDVELALHACASELLDDFATEILHNSTYKSMRGLVKHDRPIAGDVVQALFAQLEDASRRVSDALQGSLSHTALAVMLGKIKQELSSALAGQGWRSRFRGRDILKRFCGKLNGPNYVALRNVIIAEMAKASYQPPAMARVLERL